MFDNLFKKINTSGTTTTTKTQITESKTNKTKLKHQEKSKNFVMIELNTLDLALDKQKLNFLQIYNHHTCNCKCKNQANKPQNSPTNTDEHIYEEIEEIQPSQFECCHFNNNNQTVIDYNQLEHDYLTVNETVNKKSVFVLVVDNRAI